MTARRIVQLQAGVAGLGLLRLYPDGPLDEVGRTLTRLAAIVASDEGDLEDTLEERDTGPGYDDWSRTYDGPNPVLMLDDPILDRLLAAAPVGDAADVACGTGRIAMKLLALGHRVIAVDANQSMLAVLAAKGTEIETRLGLLERLPIADSAVDVLTCALALTHVADLAPVFREFARVLRVGGEVILSDIHPLVCATGGQAFFRDAEGRRRFVRNRVHFHSDYIAAFVDAGLEVAACIEPRFGPALGHLLSPGREIDGDLALAAFNGLPGLLIWRATKRG